MDNIFVAKLGKTIGLKGTLKIFIDSDFPEQFKKNATLTTFKNQNLTIEYINLKNSTVKFMDINTIEDAKKYTNSQLFTDKKNTIKNCKLEKNQYFWFDLINCKIIQDNELLGKIKDIYRYPTDDYFEICTNIELLNDDFNVKTFLLPYNKNYIIDVDISSKKIVVKDAKDILLQS
jgi:16S rRNA processing protein RimM